MSGCGQKLLGGIVLLVGSGFLINSCAEHGKQLQHDEEVRRQSLTPEQREAEAKAAADAVAANEALARDTQLEAQAYETSKDYVRGFLKHPDDASFGFFSAPTTRWNSSRTGYFVESTVVAKNDFGAELTYRWATILSLRNNTWQLVSCVIDDKLVYDDEQAVAAIRAEAGKQAADMTTAAKRDAAAADAARQAATDERKWRTWSSGPHTLDAKFDGMSDRVVKLKKRDGSFVKVPLEKLSADDQAFILKRKWAD